MNLSGRAIESSPDGPGLESDISGPRGMPRSAEQLEASWRTDSPQASPRAPNTRFRMAVSGHMRQRPCYLATLGAPAKPPQLHQGNALQRIEIEEGRSCSSYPSIPGPAGATRSTIDFRIQPQRRGGPAVAPIFSAASQLRTQRWCLVVHCRSFSCHNCG